MSDSLLRRQDETIESLQLLSADSGETKGGQDHKLLKQKTSSFMRRQSTLQKLDRASEQF